jgi:hypothetical protein
MMQAEVTLDAETRGQALYHEYSVEHQRVGALGVGFDYDPGAWFVSAEANQLHTHSFLGNTHAVRASAGYRWGGLTPWVGYTRIKAERLNARLNGLRKIIPQQSTVSTGLRWDFRRDFALKLEYQRILPRDDLRAALDLRPGLRPAGPVEVASVALDFVF